MGYVQGQGLGVNQQGRAEPVAAVMHLGRAGFAAKEEIREKKREARHERKNEGGRGSRRSD